MSEALRIIRYLVSTKDLKLQLFNENDKVFDAPISWSSRKQDIVSTSTTEAEFYAISEAVKECHWLKNVLKDFDVVVNEPIKINSDNQSTIKMVENSKFSSRTKHIDVRLHFVRDYVDIILSDDNLLDSNTEYRKINLVYCKSEDNVADLLTKPLAGVKIKHLRQRAALY